MSIKNSVLTFPGDHAPLVKVLRCISLFLKRRKKMLITICHVHYACRMLFTDGKYREVRHLGESNLSECISNQKYPPNFDENKNKIRSILSRYGNFRIDDGVIYYLDGIYENIPDYIEEEINFNNKYNATDIITKCKLTSGYSGVAITRAIHFDWVHEILSPYEKIEILWDIEKKKEDIEKYIRKKISVRYRISDDLFQRLTE